LHPRRPSLSFSTASAYMVQIVLSSRLASENHPLIRDALAFAREHLSDIYRGSGEDYCTHVTEVATTLEEVVQDDMLTAVAILHDIPMHPRGEELLAIAPLSAEQRELVLGMHELRRLHIDINTTDLDRMVEAFAEDSRLLLLRMAHRMNDVRHLERFNAKRRQEIAHETLHMYTSISGRLGFHQWRWQMEDICFMELQPQEAGRIRKLFDDARETDEACLRHATSFIQSKLKLHGINAAIDERIKGVYSTYRKMVLKDRAFQDLTDRLALRILVPSLEDCYRTLGIIHENMHPIRGKLKDYIGSPKENGYRSIHTVVYPLPGISELPIEIQIRTHEMHRECEFGFASHGNYKHWRYMLSSPQSRANLFRNLESLHAVIRSQSTFMEALKNSFGGNKLLVFDPQNNLYHLPHASTAQDFVNHIEPEAKNNPVTLRINGREQPLSAPLRDGDTVEVVFDEADIRMKHIRSAEIRAKDKLQP
jgi:guanosine-3',5'-bis(diphosphate) 3'-pyrophosphohydrolase